MPKVSFTRVEDDTFSGVGSVADAQARSYGYNDGSAFKLPDQYIRYIEPLESELAVQVEYDMDEQDQEWLDSVNAERRNANLDKVSYETFEIIMDRLEKEWFDLTKNLPKPDLAMPSEDSTCAICDDSEGENTNAIVFCDGCNLAVHQDCYGVPYIPEGQWLCRKCTVSPENPVSCILCPNEGGAFKQTVHGEWVHLLCAIWVPETRVANDVFMEPVTGVDRIPKQRWKLKCQICEIRMGACIQCIKNSCFSAFHATCARKEKLLMPMKASQGSEAPTLAAYCEKHLPREQAEARLAALNSEHINDAAGSSDANQSKTARAYAKTYKPGPPLVPKIIVDRIMQYIGRINVRHKREFVVLVCKYWSLKREARRGAPLLKRLHLEPWTASASGRHQSDEDKAFKLTLLKDLRADLERLRTLSDATRQREMHKLRQANCIQQVLRDILYPSHVAMRKVFEDIKSGDKSDYFLSPVSKVDVPDYYDVIKRPMCWSVIDRKLTEHQYLDLQDFKDDIFLVLDNAMVYNKPDTPYFKAARRIKNAAERVLPELDRFATQRPAVSKQERPEGASEPAKPDIGDLEPPLYLLDLLEDPERIRRECRFVLDKPPIDALLSYEFGEPKAPQTPAAALPLPLPEPPHPAEPIVQTEPTAPPTPAPKIKRDRRQEKARARERRATAALGISLAHPKTRRGKAVAGAAGDSPTAEGPAGTPVGTTQAQPVEGAAPAQPIPPEPQTESTADGEPPAKRQRRESKHWKRAPVVQPGHSDVPPVVEDVDMRQSFSRFDQGWILPQGQRRRPLPERSYEPKRKNARSERPASTTPNVAKTVEESPVVQPEAGPSEPSSAPIPLPPTVEEAAPPAPEELPGEREPTSPRPATPMDVDVEGPPQPFTQVEVPESVPFGPSPPTQDTNVEPQEQEEAEIEAVREEEEESPAEPRVLELVPEPAEPAEPEEGVPTPLAAPVILPAEESGDVEDDDRTITDIPPGFDIRTEQELPEQEQDAEATPMPSADQPADVESGAAEGTPEVAAEDQTSEDQASELTALSDSDAPRSPLRCSRRKKQAREAAEEPPPPSQESEEASAAPDDDGEDEVETLEDEPGPSTKKRPGPKPGKGKAKGKRGRKSAMGPPIDPDAGKVVLKRGQPLLEAGTLVWAKFTGFPWWPAVVFDFDDEAVPASLKAGWTRKKMESEHIHIVRFFDEHDTWQAVGLDQILMLGEDNDLDEDLLAAKSRRQVWKQQKHRAMCRKAFLRALEEMEV